MILRNLLLGTCLAEQIQLLLVFSTHPFLSVCVVETGEFSCARQSSSRPILERQCDALFFEQPSPKRVTQWVRSS
jgi:hypothetical protein